MFNDVDNSELKLNKLAEALKEISISNESMPSTCCIYGDNDCPDLPPCTDMEPIDTPAFYQRAKKDEQNTSDSEEESTSEISDSDSNSNIEDKRSEGNSETDSESDFLNMNERISPVN